MSTAQTVFMVVLVTYTIFMIGMLLRANQVYTFRSHLLDDLSEASEVDIQKGRSYQWRFDEFSSVKFNDMVFHFWKPIKSFYKDYKFTQIQN